MWSKCLRGYLKRIQKVLLWGLLSAVCFALVFYLSDVPLAAAGYAALLSIICGLLIAAADFARYFQSVKKLSVLNGQDEPVIEELPEAFDLLEEEYGRLVLTLHGNIREFEREYERSRQDLTDYYTLWVHQIKTPIFAMRLLLQAREQENREAMEMELFKIEQYTDMVLQYLRLGSATNDFVLQAYDLDDMIRQALRKYAKLFIGRKLSLDFRQTHQKILSDEKWFVFVLEQLLSNALKYTYTGKVSVFWADGALIMEDTGIGISPEDLPRIFEKGYTGFNGRMDKKATGLGLYLCRQICGRLNCGIDVESAPGKGTRVKLSPPLPA